MASSAEVRIAMVAGEVSGDMLAARLIAGLRPQLPQARFTGIGGAHMIAQGFASQLPMDVLTVRGIFEVIPRYREIKGIQTRLAAQLLAEPPAVFVGADYPGFNLGLEEKLKAGGIPTVHFISPQIWAWRGGRIKQIRRAVSHMLCIFPFEEAIYRQAQVPATYIGHPLAEMIPLQPDQAAARLALGIAADARVVTIMPGSRMAELKFLVQPFLAAARLLAARDPSLRFVVPMAGARQRAYFAELAGTAVTELAISVVDDSHSAICAADAVLVASGTATLEVALYKKPMVIAYKVMQASWLLMRHMGYQPWIGLPNILAREFLVPELLQHAATPAALAEALWRQLNDGANRDRLVERFTAIHHSLLRNSTVESAAAVYRIIESRRT
ncbi:lipid-A-disaccharide synthase [Massilia sp. PWRC2]|uniref:lipid-A-disaccharide synthase n=1 Tax=Massilia sp. PWRC2 TaxID=2804626 RepID=UPI003CE8E589